MINVLLVAVGGAFGSVCRYLVGAWTLRQFGPGFPWGTLSVNILGSFLIGFLSEWIIRRLGASSEMRLLLITGMLGGFTTFSAFSLDFVALLERGSGFAGAGYLALSVVISLAAVFGGLALGRAML
ncbi:fluoride efflux transporter CrcB [Neorhizobium sp. SOG26]|uniref:fluoride efflux transporter CrcB n=1 Tax=Neorhizobium sp. SOG26 TaxID=2060726 RepID=UPI000E5859B5|nr:fluoride efflux transporter CrcB [Neorhizobium sp. SOG26]AXV15627.1 fluoride efflux transporter CrcB [Neorhizobium sp. SOG26]